MKVSTLFLWWRILCFCISDCTVALTRHGSGTGGDCADVHGEPSVGGGPVWPIRRASHTGAAGLPLTRQNSRTTSECSSWALSKALTDKMDMENHQKMEKHQKPENHVKTLRIRLIVRRATRTELENRLKTESSKLCTDMRRCRKWRFSRNHEKMEKPWEGEEPWG